MRTAEVQLNDLDFVLTVTAQDGLRLWMCNGELGSQKARLVPVRLDGLIAKSIIRDLQKEMSNAEMESETRRK